MRPSRSLAFVLLLTACAQGQPATAGDDEEGAAGAAGKGAGGSAGAAGAEAAGAGGGTAGGGTGGSAAAGKGGAGASGASGGGGVSGMAGGGTAGASGAGASGTGGGGMAGASGAGASGTGGSAAGAGGSAAGTGGVSGNGGSVSGSGGVAGTGGVAGAGGDAGTGGGGAAGAGAGGAGAGGAGAGGAGAGGAGAGGAGAGGDAGSSGSGGSSTCGGIVVDWNWNSGTGPTGAALTTLGSWAVGAATAGPKDGKTWLATVPGGDYLSNANDWVQLPVIDLSAALAASCALRVTVELWRDTERVGLVNYDGGNLQYTTDPSPSAVSAWVPATGGKMLYDGKLLGACTGSCIVSGQNVWASSDSPKDKVAIFEAAKAPASTMTLRFTFFSDDMGEYAGIYVRRVLVETY